MAQPGTSNRGGGSCDDTSDIFHVLGFRLCVSAQSDQIADNSIDLMEVRLRGVARATPLEA